MALNVNLLRQEKPGDYVSPARLCLTAAGDLVACDDPQAVRLLVGEGCTLTRAEAEHHGLIGKREEEPTAGPEPEEAAKALKGVQDKRLKGTADK